MSERFWMVYAEGGSAPTYKHPSGVAARNEAERLAKLTLKRCYVLEAYSFCEINSVQWQDLELPGPDQIPF